MRFSGSNARFSSRNARMSRGPYIRSRNGLRARPSPCSLEIVPPNSSTRLVISSAIERERRGVAEALALAPRLELGDLGADFRVAFARILDNEDRGGVALDEAHALGLLDVLAREVEDHLVGQLDRVRTRLEDGLRGLERLLEVAVVDDVERGRPGPLHQAHPGFDDRQERALRADDQARHVEAARPPSGISGGSAALRERSTAAREGTRLDPDGHEFVQVVARHASPMLGVARADLVAVLVADPCDLAVDLSLEAGASAPRLELRGGDVAEDDAGPVGQERRDLDDMVDRQPVGDRMRAA